MQQSYCPRLHRCPYTQAYFEWREMKTAARNVKSLSHFCVWGSSVVTNGHHLCTTIYTCILYVVWMACLLKCELALLGCDLQAWGCSCTVYFLASIYYMYIYKSPLCNSPQLTIVRIPSVEQKVNTCRCNMADV